VYSVQYLVSTGDLFIISTSLILPVICWKQLSILTALIKQLWMQHTCHAL